MGFLDKLTGTARPGSGTDPLPAEDVRAVILGLNGQDVPYVVREGTAEEKADLVAEWRLWEPAWQTFFARTQMSRQLQIRMRFVPADHEVRTVDHQWAVKWVSGVPVTATRTRGPAKTVSKQWTIGRGSDGSSGLTETFRYDTSDLKDPLRNAVLKAGWTWRGIAFGRL